MPKILIVAATPFETEAIAKQFTILWPNGPGLLSAMAEPGPDVSLLTTGVGMVNTAYALGRCSGDFEYVINVGICGAFDRSIALGEVVLVRQDTLSELGAEDGDTFLPYPELNLGGTHVYHHALQKPIPILEKIKPVRGITVNKVHGRKASIDAITTLFQPQVESMEGAAFFRSCAHFKGTYLQVRAVSNYVERRDKSKWNIPLALANLNSFVIQLINALNT